MTPTVTRCADCSKIGKLVKCSKEGCSNQLCPQCVERYSGKHCNGCYEGLNVMFAEWAMSGDNPPNAIGVDVDSPSGQGTVPAFNLSR
jgi:hypothetical protein